MLPLYTLTIFLGAALLFLVQPMAGKALLPLLGGVPAAWTACLLFFQGVLLLGYAYVYATERWLSLRARIGLHVLVVALPGAQLLFGPDPSFAASLLDPSTAPLGFVLLHLSVTLLGPFFAMATTSPLLQDWLAKRTGRRPYPLYAASNAGSLGAVVAYPFLIEPALDLGAQRELLVYGYGAFVALIALSAALAYRGGPGAPPAPRPEKAAAPAERPSWRARLRWVFFAAVPSLLLVGVTSYLSLDLAPLPLVWVLPLGLYLLTFILAFAGVGPPMWAGRVVALLSVVLVVTLVLRANTPMALLLTMHLSLFFLGAWLCHARLYEEAPEAAHLPELYVWIALGGALGSAVGALIAPALFSDLYEYPIAIALLSLARPQAGQVREDGPWRMDLAHALIVAAVTLAAIGVAGWVGHAEEALAPMLTFAIPVFAAYRFMPLRRRYALCLLALLAAGTTFQERGAERLLLTRGFFGVLRVLESEESGRAAIPSEGPEEEAPRRHLLHGSTLHGSQRVDQRGGCEPLVYYTRNGPLGQAMGAFRAQPIGRQRGAEVAVVGLGAGSLACYAEEGERWRFFEINPQVIEIARDPARFTFLRNSPAARVRLVRADGRVGLRALRPGSQALMILDAFNSDAVPVHLLTREALREYLRVLHPDGWMLLHVSNRALDLRRAVSAVARAEGLHARASDRSTEAIWVALSHRPGPLALLPAPLFAPLPAPELAPWTDAYSSVLPLLMSPETP